MAVLSVLVISRHDRHRLNSPSMAGTMIDVFANARSMLSKI